MLLDGRGKKIHLRNGVVTLRNALGLHALPERCRAIGDNRVIKQAAAAHERRDDVAREEDGVGRSATAEIVARKPDAASRRYRYGPARSRC